MPSFAFDSPWYLLLLALAPILWWLSFRRLTGLGNLRRLAALAFRTAVLVLLVLALCETQVVRTSERLTVIYLLDQSHSIPAATRRAMIELVNTSVRRHRQQQHRDRVGVIVFGRQAAVEVPPVETEFALGPQIESIVDLQHTNLADAIELSASLFPGDTARRLVIVSDGNQNLGDAQLQAEVLSRRGTSIDVVPVLLDAPSDVLVDKIAVAPQVRQGQPFSVRVVLSNTSDRESAPGKLQIVRTAGERVETVAEQAVDLQPGKQVFIIRQQVEAPDFYTYEARFVPDAPAADAIAQNNRAATFTRVSGRGHVLLIENWESPGEFDSLAELLRREEIQVTTQTSDQLFGSLAKLQRYDAVILANVPRTSGGADRLTHFSDDQIEMLVENTRQLGAGLVMLGGSESFGAGGWANTRLEQAMPVDFQVKNTKVVPSGALALVIDKSSSMTGQKIALSRVAAREAIGVLGTNDYVGVVAFDTAPRWIVPMRQANNRQDITRRLTGLVADGGTDMFPGMRQGYQALRTAPASVKHMIVLTDGQTPQADFVGLTRQMQNEGIGVSTVGVGTDAATQLLSAIAREGRGKFYHVLSPKAIPRIFIKEALRVARPLVYERPEPFAPRIVFPHEIVTGLEDPLPAINGLVLTTVKNNPLVEVVIESSQPATRENATLLATWTYGAGKSVAWTTDTGARWANQWADWDGTPRLFSRMVRWAMRPIDGSEKFTIATDIRDGRGRVVVTALGEDDEFLNFLSMTGSIVGPDAQARSLALRQTAPGRYVGEFDAQDMGNHFLVVHPGPGHPPLRAGINVPYSDEFRDRVSNPGLLESLAQLTPAGGQSGQVAPPLRGSQPPALQASNNPFRRDFAYARSSQDIWPLLLLVGSCIFWLDIFNRRVQIDWNATLAPAANLWRRLRQRPAPATSEATLARLQRRKSTLDEQFASRQASARFESTLDDRPEASPSVDVAAGDPSSGDALNAPDLASNDPSDSAADSYTQRLLRAKRQAAQSRRDTNR